MISNRQYSIQAFPTTTTATEDGPKVEEQRPNQLSDAVRQVSVRALARNTKDTGNAQQFVISLPGSAASWAPNNDSNSSSSSSSSNDTLPSPAVRQVSVQLFVKPRTERKVKTPTSKTRRQLPKRSAGFRLMSIRTNGKQFDNFQVGGLL